MFQEFFSDTLMGRFIKRLLRATDLPLLHIVDKEAALIKGCRYIYKNFIIECEQSGLLYLSDEDRLYPSDTIYPLDTSSFLPDIGNIAARFKVLDYYKAEDPNIHYRYHSKHMYYDSDTHYYLGEYLRYLKDRTGLNLLPYYNCFNYVMLENLSLNATTPNNYVLKSSTDKKLIAIPVKFGRSYTIAIDSDTPVELRSIIYKNGVGNVYKDYVAGTYYSDDINDYEFLPSTYFTKPFLKRIPLPDTAQLYNQEKNLYLTIQVSADNNSSIVVLEGDYTDSWNPTVLKTTIGVKELTPEYRNLSLLHFNTRTSFAFSDRLIEYLLLNIINPTETIADNFHYLDNLISKTTLLPNNNYLNDSSNRKRFTYIWNNSMRDAIQECIKTILNDTDLSKVKFLRDQDGYLNKDIENILLNSHSEVDA